MKYTSPMGLGELGYDPFGSVLEGRNWEVGSGYRFGFNTQEQDDEVYGNSKLNTAIFWQYDTRLGRRWNLDPIDKTWESNYAVFSNNPIYLIDPNGDKAWKPEQNEDGSTTLVGESGDNAASLSTYLANTDLDKTVTYGEFDQYVVEMDAYASQNDGSAEGFTISSEKFENIVGSTLMRMYSENKGALLWPTPNEECSPTSWNRADAATELVYNSDVLGTYGGDLYRAWTMWDKKYVPEELKAITLFGGAKVVSYLDLGYEITLAQAMGGSLKPGAILNLQSRTTYFGHSVIFTNYIYNDNQQIVGFMYWQQYTEIGQPSKSFLGTSLFSGEEGYYILLGANWH